VVIFGLSFSIKFLIFAGVFILAFFIQMFYYLNIFGRIIFHKKKKSRISYQPVSIVICAKNESDNLKKNLPFVLNQDYPYLIITLRYVN